jgi:hypothetical protein
MNRSLKIRAASFQILLISFYQFHRQQNKSAS